MKRRLSSIAMTAMVVIASGASRGVMADDTAVRSVPSVELSSETEQLIEHLDSASFIQRDWAARQLMSRGASVVPQLESAIRHERGTEALLTLLARMSQSNDPDMAASSLRTIASLRDETTRLSAATRTSVETAYRDSIRVSLAQLTLLGAVVTRDEEQNIIHLQVRSDQFGDRQLLLLSPLTALHSLDLRDTQITNAGLKHLKSLTALVSLNVSDTQVTSPGLRELVPLQSLKQLIAYRIDVLPADLDWLREHLPGIRIISH